MSHGTTFQERKNRFRNALNVMRSLDRHELVAAKVLPANEERRWSEFCRDPLAFFVRCDDTTCDALWALVEARSAR